MAETSTRDGVSAPSSLTFLAGGGEMGALMRTFDWSKTPPGDPHTWPQSLRSAIGMLLPSKAQIILFWGPEFNVFYNDAYRPTFGAKHPQAHGLAGRDAWSEIWDGVLHGLLAEVVRTGEAFWGKDLPFTLERNGFPEDTYFDVSYDPLRVESGLVGGVFCITAETTERVIGQRRLALLKDLAASNATARTTHEACVLATDTIAAYPLDITFALAYIDNELQSSTPGAVEQHASTPPALVKELPIASSSGEARARLVSASTRGGRSTINTGRSSIWWPISSVRRWRMRAPTRKNGSAPRHWRRSIARRRRSSATSATNSVRRLRCCSDRSRTRSPRRRRRCRPRRW